MCMCTDFFYYGIVDSDIAGNLEWGCTRKVCMKFIETKLELLTPEKKYGSFARCIIDDLLDDLENIPTELHPAPYNKAIRDVIQYLKETRKVFEA